ncbi:MAG: hypothetical protein C0412_04410 [Flavobacterium sp.]|nr:hypothetical protein [Flavobacterium sp.]
MMEMMKRPKTREEFERNFHLLTAEIKSGRFQILRKQGKDLAKITFLPNGRINFLSVNESARLAANTSSHFNSERMKNLFEELKSKKND